jgi:hypothetical protein
MNAIDRLFRRHLIVNWYNAIENDGIVITRTLQEPFILPKSLIRMVLAIFLAKIVAMYPTDRLSYKPWSKGAATQYPNAGLTPKKCR